MILLAVLCGAAAAYQIVAILACLRQLLRREAEAREYPPVSILKPIAAADAAIASHAAIDYPRFEVLLGVSPGEAAPSLTGVDARVVVCPTSAANPKVGKLIDLAREARYPVLVANDADIVVPRDYLRRIVAPLEDARVGLVTCLYRARAGSWPARMEALGIATDFAPSALVAPLLGISEFGLGSTLCFRTADLARIGGFESIASFVADDYHLGKRISQAGLKVVLSKMVVATDLGAGGWTDVWRHQVRWARTIRRARGAGYVGLPITNAAVWSIAAFVAGWTQAAAVLLALRISMGLLAGLGVLRDPLTVRLWWLMPLRDLFGIAIWAAGLFGNTVYWRNRVLRLDGCGRIMET